MMSDEHDLELDARGLVCPEPVMMLHNRINEVPVNGVLMVMATDPSTKRDIPRFCQFMGHELVNSREQERTLLYWIRRRE